LHAVPPVGLGLAGRVVSEHTASVVAGVAVAADDHMAIVFHILESAHLCNRIDCAPRGSRGDKGKRHTEAIRPVVPRKLCDEHQAPR